MFLTGFADEASSDFKKQIAATLELGWKYIEARMIGKNFLAYVPDAEFEEVCGLLQESGVSINCYGSGIANWKKDPWSEEDFVLCKDELARAIPRMKRLGIKMLRGMSFKIPGPGRYDSPEYEANIFKKVNELVNICEDNGIIYGHENCMNYGGQSYVHTLRLLDNIKSPNFKLIFDTGNPVFNFKRLGEPPFQLQNSREFYENVREFIYYVHIKDSIASIQPDGTIKNDYTYAGEGNADIPWILTDLLKHGYDGGFSMEPHVATVFHDKAEAADPVLQEKRKYTSYVDYGRRFEKLLEECRKKAAAK